MKQDIQFKSGYSEVNGIQMYYEIHGTEVHGTEVHGTEILGTGKPLVLIHGGGSTIDTTFGRVIRDLSAKYQVIAVELQNHGHSGFRDIPQTFEQDADDVAALLRNLGISRADFLGFSNGGTTALQIAIRHPELAGKLVLASAAFKRNGLFPGFFDMIQQASLDNMPGELKEAFLKINPDSHSLQIMFERDRDRMIAFEDIPDEQIRSVSSPTLLVMGDRDVVTPEHLVEMYRLLPDCRLLILPGGHGAYLKEIATLNDTWQEKGSFLSVLEKFLDEPEEGAGQMA